jgi:hypothetical protein
LTEFVERFGSLAEVDARTVKVLVALCRGADPAVSGPGYRGAVRQDRVRTLYPRRRNVIAVPA